MHISMVGRGHVTRKSGPRAFQIEDIGGLSPAWTASAADRRGWTCLLRLVVRSDADRLVVVGRIELRAIAAPGGVLQDAVDLAKPGRRKPQRDDLPDPHHDVPAYDFGARRGKGFVKALFLELGIEFAQRARLVMFEKYREHNGVVGGRCGVFGRRRRGLRTGP